MLNTTIRLSHLIPKLDDPQEVVNQVGDALKRFDLATVIFYRPPRRRDDWPSYCIGQNVFWNSPEGQTQWPEFARNCQERGTSALSEMTWRTNVPFTIGECRQEIASSRGAWSLDFHADHGRHDGLLLACGNWCGLIASSKPLHLSVQNRSYLLYLGNIMAQQFDALTAKRKPSLLTLRELETLQLLSHGLTHEMIASKMGVKESTIETNIERAQVKLGTRNQTHSVATAICRGLIRCR